MWDRKRSYRMAVWDGDCKLWRGELAWKDDPAWGFPVHMTGLLGVI